MSGQKYEIVLCCLFLLRSLRIATSFRLFCNYEAAGKFDDVLLFYRLQGDATKYRAIFLQAKHKDKYSEKKLTLSNPFQLKKYLDSFKKEKYLREKKKTFIEETIELEDITLVLYTSTGCSIGKNAVDVTNLSEVQNLKDFLNTGGQLLQITEPQRVGLPQGPETLDFLKNLLLCTRQMDVTTADGFLEEEIMKLLGLTSPAVAKELVSELKRQVKAWWSEPKSVRCLTAGSEEWLKVLRMQMARLNSDILNTDRVWKLDFNQAALETLNYNHQRSKNVWLHVTDKYQATVMKVRLFRALGNPLVIGVKSHQDRLEEVEALWGTSICPTLILDMTDGLPEKGLLTIQRLQPKVLCDVRRNLVVINNENPIDDGWYEVKAEKIWAFLHPLTEERLLSMPVNHQGTIVALRKIVGSRVQDVMSDEVIISLSECENGVKFGQITPRPLDYYVSRCLQRTTSRTIRFDTLHNTDTFIFSPTNSSIENEFTNRFKTLSITDVHTIHKIEGPTFIKKVNSHSDIQRLCSKFHVRGISGETTSVGIEGNVTEFIPFPWLCDEKVLIVEGCPGVGKSSFVTAMCWEVKKKFPEAWVLRMEMGRHTDYIKKMDFENFSDIQEFLLKDVNGLERLFLHHSLSVTGNVFLFLDAFDEIFPDFTRNCCDLLDGIVKTVKFRKMIVTTRPIPNKVNQKVLNMEAFTLPVLSKKDQILLLERLSVASGRNSDHGKIVSLCQSAVPVLEIPLLCTMAAEVLLNRDHRLVINSQNPWYKVLMYKWFFEQSVENRITEKCGLGASSRSDRKLREDFQAMQFHKQQEFAVKKLMPTIQISTVYDSPKEKLGHVNSWEAVDFKHQTFAEYFLGCWLAGHWQEHPHQTREFLLKGDCDFVAATLSWWLFEGFPLHTEVAKGDADAVRSLLSAGATIADRGGRTALHVAAMTRGEHRQVWDLLVSASKDLLKRKDNVLDATAAKYAELCENWEFLDFLVEKGATLSEVKFLSEQNSCQEIVLDLVKRDLKTLCQCIFRQHIPIFQKVDDEGNTLVHVAAAHNSTRVLLVLVEMRHDVNELNKTGNTPLHEASRKGHLEAVKTLIENRSDINMRNKGGETSLILAAAQGHLEVVKLLIENGCDPNVRTKRGDTAVILANTHGHSEVLNLLVQNGGDPNINGSYVESPMTVADCQGHIDVVEMLIQNSLDPNVKDLNCDTPLILAALRGQKGVVKMLIENGVDPNMQTETGETVLTLTARQGHLDMVKLLIELNIDLSVTTDNGNTALMEASREGHVEVARLLIQSGADPNVKNKRFETALMLASGHGRLEVVKMMTENGRVQTLDCDMALTQATIGGHDEIVNVLIDNGAVPNLKSKGGYTMLMLAAREGYQEMVEAVLQTGVDPNIKTKDGETALSLAASRNHVVVVKILIDNGACPNIKNNDGYSVLMQAVRQGHLDVMKVLLDDGPVRDIKTEAGYALLMQAVCEGRRDMVKLLIQGGADPNLKPESGCPLLIQAVRQGDLEVVEVLTANGADPNVPDFNEETALMNAALIGHLEIVETLIQKGADRNAKNCYDETALILAARRGHLEIVRMLIVNGADTNTKNGETALDEARRRGHQMVVKLLIANGADPNVKTEGEGTELMHAAVQFYLEENLDDNQTTKEGNIETCSCFPNVFVR